MSDHFFSQKIFSNHSSRVISEERKPYLIAEIGLNHNNDMDFASTMIEKAAQCGADCVKFQSYTTDKFIDKESAEARAIYDIFSRYELSEHDHDVLKKAADNNGIDFISTPLTTDWVEILAQIRVPFFKIASGDLNNYMLLKETVKYKIPHFVSTGASYWNDIEKSAAFFKMFNFKDVVFLHCVSNYPAPTDQLNLDTIVKIRREIGSMSGFSDHSQGAQAAFASAMLGATVIEKHFTLDKNMEGPDHAISAEPEELVQIREGIDLANQMKGEREEPDSDELKGEILGKRSIYNVNGDLLAMRPRRSNLPKDSDYFNTL
ncbi:MAG: N-acetylneuraminate synthase family protein [Leptospirales bacterium]